MEQKNTTAASLLQKKNDGQQMAAIIKAVNLPGHYAGWLFLHSV
jgi:hypothetical protein